MPNRNGYLPLGQDDQDIPEQDQDQDQDQRLQSKDAQTRRHVTVTVTEQELPQGSHHITINSSTSGRQQRPLSPLQDKARRRASSTSAASQTTAAASPLSSPRFSDLNETTASASASSSTAPTGTSSSPSATFHRTLRGLQDQYSPNNSSFNDSSPSPNGKAGPNATTQESTAAEVALEDRQNRRSRRASASADLGFLRLRQHPHTTESGPRGIEKAQKRQVLRDIRPDPHNLPEELLREQARSEAAVDAISRGALYHPQQDMGHLSPLLPNSPGYPGVGGGSPGLLSPGSSPGSGTGAGPPGTTGIPAAGGNRERSSKWRRRLHRLTRPRSRPENRQRVFHSSVFTPVRESVIDGQHVKPPPVLTPDHDEPMTSERFVTIVDSVKEAIKAGIQPERIAQGSSGSYFCRTKDGRKVGVFKPKNEEPYGQLNPKWTKWIHRNLFPCCFGRSCLIPNLGYLSEAATSLVDRRLKLSIVPTTEVVWLSSPAFHYDYLDRRAAKLQKGAKPLPDKVGSFQLFLHGFNDANLFLRDHPWPIETAGDSSGSSIRGNADAVHGTGFSWTPALQQQFREQFEKMIILDYLIRNTDRGLDNWMIRYCERDGITITAGRAPQGRKGNLQAQMQQAATRGGSKVGFLGKVSGRSSSESSSSSLEGSRRAAHHSDSGRGSSEGNNATGSTSTVDATATATATATTATAANAVETVESYYGSSHVHVAAIDNGLAFPFKHPDSWRSYPYGWLFLPDPIISEPFTKATRDHFLPLLSSPVWWRETVADLRKLFSIDTDFDEGMFDRQMGVMKGQGWNIVETLKNPDHGPKDLCRRLAVIVLDEEVKLGPGVSPEMAREYMAALRQQQQQEEERQKQQQQRQTGLATTTTTSHSYIATPQPKTISETPRASYSQYGSIMHTGDRLSTAKALSSSSTAIGENTPILQHSSLRGSLPHLVINMKEPEGEDEEENEATLLSKHDALRQVVSDGEYTEDDDYSEDDDDEDDFFYDEDYPRFDDEMEGLSRRSSTRLLAPPQQGGMISIDKALANADGGTPSQRRRASQSEGGRRRQRSSSDAMVAGMRNSTVSKHRHHRMDSNDRPGAIRFDTSSAGLADRMRRSSATAERQRSSETRILIPSNVGGVGGEDLCESPDDQEPERGRSSFARGIASFREEGSPEERLSERPKWADRLRRGLSFDGHLIGQSRNERKRKQRQRERERVVIIEQVELVTKNLPYFKWW
ncbi:MAG: phosphatidylinositol 3 and 4-kinase-domain-containing protein [Benniella sp.]|nr:MAG: phosphatidylinositol 3 and 4-kinase-domain-containing protein [Benniella sp.]